MWPFNKKQEKHCQFMESNDCSLIAQLREKQKQIENFSLSEIHESMIKQWYDADENYVNMMRLVPDPKLEIAISFFYTLGNMNVYERNKILNIITEGLKKSDEYAALNEEIRALKSKLEIK
jgi:hypothetical protein